MEGSCLGALFTIDVDYSGLVYLSQHCFICYPSNTIGSWNALLGLNPGRFQSFRWIGLNLIDIWLNLIRSWLEIIMLIVSLAVIRPEKRCLLSLRGIAKYGKVSRTKRK